MWNCQLWDERESQTVDCGCGRSFRGAPKMGLPDCYSWTDNHLSCQGVDENTNIYGGALGKVSLRNLPWLGLIQAEMIFVVYLMAKTQCPLLHSPRALFEQYPLRNAGLATPGTMVRLRFALPAV